LCSGSNYITLTFEGNSGSAVVSASNSVSVLGVAGFSVLTVSPLVVLSAAFSSSKL